MMDMEGIIAVIMGAGRWMMDDGRRTMDEERGKTMILNARNARRLIVGLINQAS